jgi:DNA-binding response OmpR family regulator
MLRFVADEGAEPTAARANILIVDDEPGIVALLQEQLSADGFHTAVAAAGRDALAMADTGDYDLLVLDLGLPDTDGLTVLSELRARGRDIPVVILTARGDVNATVAGLEAGADDYIAKPFRIDELLARVKARLRD